MELMVREATREEKLEQEIRELREQRKKLVRLVGVKDQIIEDQRKTLKAYRKRHMEAYGKYINGQYEDMNQKNIRWSRSMMAFCCGMATVMVLTVALIALY